ncbi:helix-turn-helix transcriptional regulator [Planctellipticum variicoloris]|uniref:helix-turn-helix transcriptional regulator n=1 Tax=Planctellipticum variicoloris TaxID=3064265 RepID=UPI003013E616|nr:helix-turn-helix domain-containing protein [Planctomycetaceae bacterium SH412]
MLAARLTDARKSCGLTEEAAAEHLGCSHATLIAIEQGTRPPKPEELLSLAELYGCRVHDLVRSGEPFQRFGEDCSRREGFPDRDTFLAVQAYDRGDLSEGQLAGLLGCNRVTARETVERFRTAVGLTGTCDDQQGLPESQQ